MRKLLTILLALAIAFALLPGAAGAAGRGVPKPEIRTAIIIDYAYEDEADFPGIGKPGGGGGGTKDNTYYELLGPKWAKTANYLVDPKFSPVDAVLAAAEITAAFEEWDAVTGSKLFSGSLGSDATPVEFKDGLSTVSFRILAGLPNALAVAVLQYLDNDGSETMTTGDDFTEFDILFNLKFKWGVDQDGEGTAYTLPKRTWDIRNIGTHEAGHAVGLADLYDSKYSELTMYGYAAARETKKVSLETGDKSGTTALYGP